MTKKPLHPLITKGKNKHYDQGKEPGIVTLEKKYTVDQMIVFCSINIDKYLIRQDYKNQSEEDRHKIDKYNEYKAELQSMLAKSQTLKYISVTEAFKLLKKEWRYS